MVCLPTGLSHQPNTHAATGVTARMDVLAKIQNTIDLCTAPHIRWFHIHTHIHIHKWLCVSFSPTHTHTLTTTHTHPDLSSSLAAAHEALLLLVSRVAAPAILLRPLARAVGAHHHLAAAGVGRHLRLGRAPLQSGTRPLLLLGGGLLGGLLERRGLLDALRRGGAGRGGGCGLLEGGRVDGEFDGVGGALCAEVVHAGLEALPPSVEVHRGELPVGGVAHVDVQTLRLVYEGAPVCRHVDDGALGDLPHRLVQRLQLVGYLFYLLDGSVACDELLLDVVVPQAQVDQVAQQVGIHYHKLSGEHPAGIEVGRVGLDRLVVA
mmetsp:Transcript_18028/g.43391  ORF Transcript_18028/g.43391 Transcript_18028/m.43391 type:complete len:321 (+) Transcript_18028:185-1147(+)